MTEDESTTDRKAATQVLREIADEVESGECRGFGIVCSGGRQRGVCGCWVA